MNDLKSIDTESDDRRAAQPFRLTVTMQPSFLSAAYLVERDLSQVEALTFLQTIRQGIQIVGESSPEQPEIYLARLRHDSHECFSIRDERFCFELGRGSSQDLVMTAAKEMPICPECGSDKVSADAAVRWSIESQAWEVGHVFDKGRTCDDCESTDLDLSWVPIAG